MYKYHDKQLLKKFMKEWFPFELFRKSGVFTQEMKGDYEAQAERICNRLGIESIYEYGHLNVGTTFHLTYDKRPLSINKDGQLKESPFVEIIKSIYETSKKSTIRK